MKLTEVQAFVLIAISVPATIGLRTVAGFLNVKLPLIAVAVIEFLSLTLLFVLYGLYGEVSESAA